MKYSILMVVALYTFSIGAQELSKFKKTESESKDALIFDDGEKDKFVLSKIRFTSQEEASKFCTDNGLALTSEADALILGITGDDISKELVKALSFDLRDKENSKGVLFWSKDPKNETAGDKTFLADVAIMRNHSWMDPEPFSFKEAEPLLKKSKLKGLPAICGSFDHSKTGPDGKKEDSERVPSNADNDDMNVEAPELIKITPSQTVIP